MEKDEWIKKRIDFIKGQVEEYPDVYMIPNSFYDYISDILGDAWFRGKLQTEDEFYDKYFKGLK